MNLFLSAGAMKAGTTWLYSVLEKHPDLYFTPEKEIHFLSDYYLKTEVISDINRLQRSKIGLNQDVTNHVGIYRLYARWYAMYLEKPDNFHWYKRVFSLNKQKKYNCDFSNLTCHLSKENWEDLQNNVDSLKVIYILRDPLKRYWSHIKFHHEFMGKEINFLNWTKDQFKTFLEKPFMKVNGEYHVHLKNMQDALGENFKYFFFKDMVSSSNEFLKELELFLDVTNIEYDSNLITKKVNTSKKIEMPAAFAEVCKPIVEKEYGLLVANGIEIPQFWSQI